MTKVAVVAVHGVADQTPSSSARSIADLLCADPQGRYTEFTEVPLRIPRKPMEAGGEPAEPALRYMHGQLVDYVNNDAGSVYETIRLEGKGRDGKPGVDVYEVYWADLSRIGEGTYRLFAELYQLLLHLPSLGRNTIEKACEANRNRVWRDAALLAAWSVGIFTIVIPLLNVVLLSLVLVALSAEIPPGTAQAAVAAAVPTMALLGAGTLLLSRKRLPRPLVFYGLPLLIVGAGTAFAIWLTKSDYLYRWVGVEAVFAAIGVSVYLAWKYSVMKPRAIWFAIPASVIASEFAVYHLFTHDPSEAGVYAAAIDTARVVVGAVGAAWLLLAVLIVLMTIVSWFAARFASHDWTLARRAAWTGRFAITFSAALFSTLTLSIWFLITTGVGELMPADGYPPDTLLDILKEQAAGLEITSAALFLFFIAAIWAATPSIVQEVAPPRPDAPSDTVGRWLSRGILLVAAAGNLLPLAFAVLLVLGLLSYDSEAFIVPVLAVCAAVVGAILTMKNLTTSIRAIVDILLDVDNYMRESPGDATPRAKIAERFVSVLRYLCAQGYERIVIVAHSQGTVISADVLRYLQAVPDPDVCKAEFRLFTMGSPLRQMYATAFPYLYSWIDTPAAANPPQPFQIANDAPPDPAGINVTQWVNAYRSGDYVGRHLWLDADTYGNLWKRMNPREVAWSLCGNRFQFCLGAGAHTHYWNRHGRDVGEYIAEMVAG
jgi:hypothetical protein